MIINAIRYKTSKSEPFKTWRFPKSKANSKHIQGFCASSGDVANMQAAMRLAISGDPSPRVYSAAIQFTDNAGDQWVVERSADRTRFHRNGKVIQSTESANDLLCALLDVDNLAEECIKKYRVTVKEDRLVAETTQEQANLSEMITKHATSASDTLRKQFHLPQVLSSSQLVSLVPTIEPLHIAYSEVSRQRNGLIKNAKSLDQVDPEVEKKLERELEIIEDIERVAKPLLDPAQTPRIVKEKLAKIEHEIKKTLSKLNLNEIPAAARSIPWHKVLESLSKIESYRQLIKTSQKAQRLFEDRLELIHSDYLGTLQKLISSDSQITQELESCLSTLSLQAEQSEQNAAKRPATLAALIATFIRPGARQSAPELQPTEKKMPNLENARMAVDFALGRLGELHASVQDARDLFTELGASVGERHEGLIRDHGLVKSHWRKIATDFKLDPEMDLAQAQRLASQYGRLYALLQKRDELRAILDTRRNAIVEIEQLIGQWRQVSGSQKSSDFANHAILISEAQAILRYQTKKRNLLSRARDLDERLRAFNKMKHHFDARLSQIKSMWDKAWTDIGCASLEMNRKDWPEIFSAAKQFAAWQQLMQIDLGCFSDDEVFGSQSASAPINIYQCIEFKNKDKLLNSLNKSKSERLILIVTSDESCEQKLMSAGIEFAYTVAPKTNSEAPKSQKIIDLLNGQSGKVTDVI